MADFRSILNTRVNTVEKPKPLPAGTYLCVVTGHQIGESGGANKTPRCRFDLKPLAPQADVDEALFAEAGGMEALTKRKLRGDFWLTEDSLYRLIEFMSDVCGIDCSEDRSLAQALPETTNIQVLAHVIQKPSADGKEIYVEISSYSKPE